MMSRDIAVLSECEILCNEITEIEIIEGNGSVEFKDKTLTYNYEKGDKIRVRVFSETFIGMMVLELDINEHTHTVVDNYLIINGK